MADTDKRVVPSSSPTVTPIKLLKRQKLAHNTEPQDLFSAYPDSPESIHSSDQCSYSSYFERKARERAKGYDESKGYSQEGDEETRRGYSLEHDPDQDQQKDQEYTQGLDRRSGLHDSPPHNSENAPFTPTMSTYATALSQLPDSPQVIPSSQEEFQGTPIPIMNFQAQPKAKPNKECVIPESDDDEEEQRQDFETLAYIRRYCTESAINSLPNPCSGL